MKNKLVILAMALVLFGTTGCMTSNLNKVVAALSADPATVHIRITSIYGVIELTRTNPTTNSPPHTISPDGTISIGETPAETMLRSVLRNQRERDCCR